MKPEIQNFLESSGKEDLKDIIVNSIQLYIGFLFKNKEYDKIIDILKLTVLLNPKPEYYGNIAFILHKQGKYLDALETTSKAIYELKMETFDLWYNHAIILKDLIRYKDSVSSFRKAISLNPDFAMAHYQLSNVLLAMGKYKEGMAEDEWRFKANSNLMKFKQRFNKPDWNGEDRVLVFSEQGFGDAIQNARYLPLLRQKCKFLVLEIQEELYELFQNQDYIDLVIPRDNNWNSKPKYHDYDSIVSINSLPYLFDPNLEETPNQPYISAKGEMPLEFESGKNIGIIWAGSHWHSGDKERSIFLKDFAPVLDIPCNFYSLQTGNMQRSWFGDNTSLYEGDNDYEIVNLLDNAEEIMSKMVDLTVLIENFNDTALLLQKLDILISVDTSTAHLAGAMGKEVWLLLPYSYEWRWQKKWYPKIKVFRQKTKGDWKSVLKEVAANLKGII